MPAVALVENIPVGHMTSAIAALRLHTATLPTGSWVRVELCAVAPTSEDPALTFKGPIVAAFEILAGTAAPAMSISPLGGRSGTHVSAYLYGQQGSGGGTFKFALSMDLRPIEGGAAWSPLDLGSKLKLWLDERDQVVVSGKITDWGDQSPGGTVDFTQGTDANRPLSGRLVNGCASPDFVPGSSTQMTSTKKVTDVATATSSCVLCVVDIDAIPTAISGVNWYNADGIIGDSGAYWGIALGTVGGVPKAAVGTASPGVMVTATISTGRRLIQGRLAGGTLYMRVDGGAESSAASGGYSNILGSLVIGRGYTGGGGFLDGALATLIAIDPAPTDVELAALRSYLSSKYGVPA